jgi:hypothetical protein
LPILLLSKQNPALIRTIYLITTSASSPLGRLAPRDRWTGTPNWLTVLAKTVRETFSKEADNVNYPTTTLRYCMANQSYYSCVESVIAERYVMSLLNDRGGSAIAERKVELLLRDIYATAER